jgi:hypothetical protein
MIALESGSEDLAVIRSKDSKGAVGSLRVHLACLFGFSRFADVYQLSQLCRIVGASARANRLLV